MKRATAAAVALLPLVAHASTYDVLVNQDVFLAQETISSGTVDNGPAGGQFILRAKVKINGIEGSLTGVQLTERLPIGSVFQGIETPGMVCSTVPVPGTVITADNADVVCPLPEITALDFTSVDFRVMLPTQSTDWKFIASTAGVSGNLDLDDENNIGIERGITTFERADLAVTITSPAAGATVTQGNVVNYTVQASNANSPYAFPLKAGERAEVRFAQPQGTVFQDTPIGTDWTCQQSVDSSTNPATPFYTCTYVVPSGQAVAKGSDLPLLTFPAMVQVASGEVPAQASIKGVDAAGSEFAEAAWENNTDNLKVGVQPNVDMDMALVKSVNVTTLDAGSAMAVPLTYTLKVSRNSGLMSPTGITVTDTLPPGMTFVSAAGTDWSCNAAAQVVTCTYGGSLLLGQSNPANFPDITLNASVPTSVLATALTADKSLLNTATLAVPNEPVANQGNNNTSDASVNITNKSNLGISKRASVSVVASGQDYYYEIPVKNNGPLNVLGGQTITITDQLDARLEFIGTAGSSTGWVCSPANTSAPLVLGSLITCTLDAGLANGATSTLRLNVKPHLSGNQFASIDNKASFNGVTGRVQASSISNVNTVKLSELRADLSIGKRAAVTGGFVHGNGASGSEVVYTLEVKNNAVAGQATQMAQTVTITDTVNNLVNEARATALGQGVVPTYANGRYLTAEIQMPSGATATAGTCTYGGNNSQTSSLVTCTLNNVPVDDALTYTIVIKARQYVDPKAADQQSNDIDNTARVSSPDTAEHAGGLPNEDSDSVTLSALTDMTVRKVSNPPSAVAAGQAVTYTLTAHNAGPSVARKVQLVDTLPVGAIWVQGGQIANGTCALGNGNGTTVPIVVGAAITAASNKLICTWNDNVTFGMNAQQVVTYQLRSVTSNPPASMANSVVVSTATPETNDQNNAASAVVTLGQAQTDVLINMKHSADGIPLDTGSTQYTVTVTNNATSSSYATGVRMIEAFGQPGSTASFEFVSLDSVQSSFGNTHPLGLDNCTIVPTAGATTGTLACDFPWLAPGEAVDIKFTMRPVALADGRPVGTVYHAASVSADFESLSGQDTNANNTTTDRTSTYDPAQVSDPDQLQFVDLSVRKTAKDYLDQGVLVGDRITYVLIVTNEEDPNQTSPVPHLINGQATLTDVLPAGLALVPGSLPNGCSHDSATNTLTCTLTNLNAGVEATFEFQVEVTAVGDAQASFVNTARIQNPGDPTPENDEDTVEVPVAEVDLSVLKTVDKSSVKPGEELRYTLVVTNHGPAASRAGELRDVLPAGLSLLAAEPANACTEATGTVTCVVDPLDPGASQTFLLTVQIADDMVLGSLTNTAVVNTPGDPNPTNDTSTVTTEVESFDLVLLKSVNKRDVKPGEELEYSLLVRNLGPLPSDVAEIRDVLPAGLTFVSSNACAITGTTVTCAVPALPKDGSQTFTFTAKVADDAALGTLSNTAVVNSPRDTNPDNDSSTVTTDVNAFDLALTKTVSKAAVKVGEELVYTLKVVNLGPLPSSAGEIRDALPAGLTFVSSDGCQFANAVVTCALESLPKDGEKLFTFTATVAEGTPLGALSNTAVVSSDRDSEPSNNESTVTTDVQAFDLVLTKSVNRDTANPTAELVYSFTVLNKGPMPSNAGEIRDVLPAGLTFVASDRCALVDATVVCAVEALPVDGEQSFTFTAHVAKDAVSGVLSNTAVVNSEGDTDPSNNESTATTEVRPLKAVPAMGQMGTLLLGLILLVLGRGRLRRMR